MNRSSHAARRPQRTPAPLLLAGLAALGLALPAAATELREVRVGAHDGFTRVVFELDHSAGYRVEKAGTPSRPVLRVTLEASSGPMEAGAHGDVRGVKVAPGAKAVATIPLGRQDLRLQEMMLANPPRIVLDLKRSDPAPAVAKTTAPAPRAAPKPAPAPVVKAPAPEPVAKAPEPVAKAPEPAVEKPAPKPEVRPEPVAVKPAPKPAPEPKPAPAPIEVAKPAAEMARPVERQEPAARPSGGTSSDVPATSIAAKPSSEAAPETADPADPADPAEPAMPAREIARRVERGTRPAPERAPSAARPSPSQSAARPAPAPAPEPGLLERLSGDPLMLGAAAGGLVALLGIVLTLRRRSRALPGDLDADAIAAELDGDDAESALPAARNEAHAETRGEDSPFADLFDAAPDESPASERGSAFDESPASERGSALDESPASERDSAPDPHDVFATPMLGAAQLGEPSDETGPPPVAGPEFDVEAPNDPSTAPDSIFDDASQGESPMNQDMDLPADRSPFDAPPPAAPSRGGASPDVAQMLEAFERRIQGLEQKLEEASEAREKLERQVAAQSEELRVQRAAIARTQRALRTMSRGDEDKATEPALREGETQAKTRVNV